MSEPIHDINGRPVMPGDLIRIFHYRDYRTGRKCYMYQLVVAVDDRMQITQDGKHLYCVSVHSIWRKRSIDLASKCSIKVIDSFEIIDGPSVVYGNDMQTWYERPRVKHGQRKGNNHGDA